MRAEAEESKHERHMQLEKKMEREERDWQEAARGEKSNRRMKEDNQ